jgi:hypothetical protein
MLRRKKGARTKQRTKKGSRERKKAGTAILMKNLLKIKRVCRIPGSVCRNLVWVSTTLLTALLELLAPIPLK